MFSAKLLSHHTDDDNGGQKGQSFFEASSNKNQDSSRIPSKPSLRRPSVNLLLHWRRDFRPDRVETDSKSALRLQIHYFC